MTERVYGREDLISSYLLAKQWEKAHADLADFYGAKYSALAKAFGIDFEDTDGDLDFISRSFFQTSAEHYLAITSPFGDLIEAPSSIAEIYQAHGEPVEAGCRAARGAIFAMMNAILVAGLGEDDRKFTPADLRALTGFEEGTPPDPWDYW